MIRAKKTQEGRGVHKYDFELKKLQIQSINAGNGLALVKHALTMGTIIACVFIIFWGLTNIASASPESVSALASLAEKLQLGQWLGYVGTAAAGSGWYLERKGRKRLLRGYAADRRRAEASDPYRSTSGLEDDGSTPKKAGR